MMNPTTAMKQKIDELQVELARQQLMPLSRARFEAKIASLESQLMAKEEEIEMIARTASAWANKYQMLEKFGKRDSFEAYSTDGFDSGRIMPNRKRPERH